MGWPQDVPANAADDDGTNGGAGAWGGDEPETNGADTNGAESADATEAKPEVPELTKEEHIKKARAAGWKEGVAFDYEEFQRQGGADADFHGASKVYEWKEEYGEVGK